MTRAGRTAWLRHGMEVRQVPDLTYAALLEQASTPGGLVLVEHLGERAVVRLNDPERLNPLSGPLTVQLLDALHALASHPSVRAVVLTGVDPGFSAGGDLRLMRDVAHPLVDDGPEGAVAVWRWIRAQFGGIVRLLTRSDKAFVAAVNGAAAGVGMALALACDLVIASERARFVSAFGRIGLLPEVGTSWFLTRRVGYHRAFELYVSDRAVSGSDAAALGIANECVPHEELLPRAFAWCDRIAALPSHAVAAAKPLLRAAADMTWDHALLSEEFAEPMCFTTDSHRRAVEALLARGPGGPSPPPTAGAPCRP